MIPLSGSLTPPGDDEKDPSFWTPERFQQFAFEVLVFLVVKVLPELFGGGGCGG
ncbi:hypothetical protein [Streptomyces chrestomyceticus]|uniref:hypothetical protein n=1 Tax=Streptomyces chrestomyceticus TaxID=68185 RepID=UPI0034070590